MEKAVHAAVPMRVGKKMRKRWELDALVGGGGARGGRLLSPSSSRPFVRLAAALALCVCVVSAAAATGLFVDVRRQIVFPRVENEMDRVSTTSHAVGDVLEECHTAFRKMRANVSTLSLALLKLDLEHSELVKRVEQAASELAAVSGQLTDTPRSIAELQQTVGSFGSQITGFEETLASTRKQALAASAGVEEVKKLVQALDARSNETIVNVTANGRREDELRQEIAALNSTLAGRVDALENKIQLYTKTTSTAAPTTTSTSTTTAPVSTTSDAVGDALKVCYTASREVRANASMLSAMLSKLEFEYSELVKRVEQAASELAAVSGQLAAAPKLADTPRRIAELQQTVGSFGSQITGFEETLVSTRKQALAASAGVEEVKKLVQALDARSNETIVNVTANGRREDELRQEIAALKSTLAGRVDALENKIQLYTKTTSTAAPTTTSTTTADAPVSTTSDAVGDALQVWHTASREVRANVSMFSARLSKLELEHSELVKRVEQAASELAAVSGQLAAAPKLADRPRRIAELQRIVGSFGSQITGFEETLASTRKQALAASAGVEEVKILVQALDARSNETIVNVTANGRREDELRQEIAALNSTLAGRVDALENKIQLYTKTTSTAAPTTTSTSTTTTSTTTADAPDRMGAEAGDS